MTLLLKTESHGIVEAGFYAAFTAFARLGEYSFATRHLCEVVQYFAENNAAHGTSIIRYDLNTFWEKSQQHQQKIILALLEQAQQSTLTALKESNLERKLEQWQTEFQFESGNEDVYNGEIIPVTISEQEQSIKIGKYIISSSEFGGMAYYLAHGGFFGWGDNIPEFAEVTMRSMQSSKRELYREIRLDLITTK